MCFHEISIYLLIFYAIKVVDHDVKHCQKCELNETETPTHFFLRCPHYVTQRAEYFHKLGELGLVDLNDVRPLTGFDPRLTSQNYRQRSKMHRRQILKCTLEFLRNSQRFIH